VCILRPGYADTLLLHTLMYETYVQLRMFCEKKYGSQYADTKLPKKKIEGKTTSHLMQDF
jgi:hypothetical protein